MSVADDCDVFDTLFTTCENVLSGSTTPQDAYKAIQDEASKSADVSSQLIDILVAIEGSAAKDEEKKGRLMKFVELITNKLVPEQVLRAELECLDANEKDFRQQLIRTKTRLYYKQTKFNLLREESEGYSKLITELLEVDSSSSSSQAPIVKTRVLSLIGQFNLDPNRVTDVILECFEHRPRAKRFFIAFLKEMNVMRDYLCSLLGFKYTFYQKSNKPTPYSLYVVTASLIQHEMIDLMKILAFMVPKTEAIKEGHRARAANGQKRASKAEIISTASIPIDASRGLDEANTGGMVQIQAVSFATVAAMQDAEDAKLAEDFTEELALSTNQKLGVACALLECGNWNDAKHLLDRLPEYYAVQASPRLCRAMCGLIERSVDGFYREKSSRRIFFNRDETSNDENSAANGLQKVKNWSELAGLSNVLWYLGPRVAYSPGLTFKLLRLITSYFQPDQKGEDEQDETVTRTLVEIIEECLLPSLTLSQSNAALSEELWTLLQLFPYSWRYRMYGKWTQQSTRHPEVNIMRGKVLGRTRYVLKRLSKETVKVMGRQLGKLCHIHPMTVLDYLLSQVQTFDNLIGPVVEGLRFLTSLEFDVLTYCIISQLANPAKQQLKASDATLSPWLQALATLVGSIYRRYTLELNGMLDYVTNQLKCCKSFDLRILREIIQNMSWVESSAGVTTEQLEALGGGELLRQEAGGYTNVKNKRASQRLRDALLNGDLAVGLCILIAQQKEHVVFEDSKNLPLKLVGEMVDQCGDTLLQLGAFLNSYVRADDYGKRMPSVQKLLSEYHLKIDSAMYLTRPTFMPKILEAYDIAKKQMRATDGEQKTKLDGALKQVLFKSSLDARVEELRSELASALGACAIGNESLRLVVVFWMLSSYDIDVPTTAYERAIEATKKQQKEVSENMEMSKAKRSKEEERLKVLETKLKDEQKKQTEHVERVRAWMAASKSELFDEKARSSESFLQTCILPRALTSEIDALYCGRFFLLLHQLRTVFPSIISIDRTFSDILPLVSALTENEANALGRFLEILLTQVQVWHSDKAIYEKECEGFPGFITKSSLNFESYKKLCYKWQTRLAKTFTTVLSRDNGDYVLIRNSLVVMTKLSGCFPVVTETAKQIEDVVLKLRDREKGRRDDLSLKAASYVGRLKMRNVKIYDAVQYADVKPPRKPATKAAKPKANPESAKTTSAASTEKEQSKKKETNGNDEGEPALKMVKLSSNEATPSKEVATPVKKIRKIATAEKKEDGKNVPLEFGREPVVPKSEGKSSANGVETNGEAEKRDGEKDRKEADRQNKEKKKRPDRQLLDIRSRRVKPKEATEEGEVTTPSPPPPKKVRALSHDEKPSKSANGSKDKEKKEETERKDKNGVDERRERRKEERKEDRKDSKREDRKSAERKVPKPMIERLKRVDDPEKLEKKKEKIRESKDDRMVSAGPELPPAVSDSPKTRENDEKHQKLSKRSADSEARGSKLFKKKEEDDYSRAKRILTPEPPLTLPRRDRSPHRRRDDEKQRKFRK